MSQALTLARPYARAAFSIARDAGAFAPWSDALGLAARVAADPNAGWFNLSAINEKREWILLIEPHHARSAGHI